MTLFDTVLVVVILALIGLLVWSRVMNQTMLETFRELIAIMKETVVDGAEE